MDDDTLLILRGLVRRLDDLEAEARSIGTQILMLLPRQQRDRKRVKFRNPLTGKMEGAKRSSSSAKIYDHPVITRS